MKLFTRSALAALSLALAVLASHPANAQQPDTYQRIGDLPLQHLAPNAMSVADSATLHARRNELTESARIYGYSLEEGNWSYEQTLCAPMPETILLHYFHKFPDGTESLFTALVPRDAGHIRIVPVLYRSATPFLPAPKNPRNYALFNDLIPPAIARGVIASHVKSLELSACYAEMTGGRADFPGNSGAKIAIAGEPSATIRLNAQDHITSVTFASLEGASAYRVWSVSFNQDGRVIAAGTEDRAVYAAKVTPRIQPVTAAGAPEMNHPEEATREVSEEDKGSAIASASSAGIPAATEQAPEPGWKIIQHPAEPVSKVMPSAPPPPEKIIPVPPDPWNKSAPADQPQ
jgi:hypothetical protein